MLKKITSSKKRLVAVLLLSTMLYEIFFPTVALALTAGPTAPEATSFEPVDTTDMVNPLTGSFTYNMPLLEVPGPEGGYPLSLSYHAGISPDLEASWVGLGWTLNPGAINRNVNGLPDDFREVSLKRRDYWAGGTRRDFGLSVGFANGMSVGLTFSQDTYNGFGIGTNMGWGFNFKGSSLGIGGGIGTHSYGDASADVGLRLGAKRRTDSKSSGLSAGIGLATNFNSISGFMSAQAGSTMGVSMSTSSSKPSLSVRGGWADISNRNAGRIQTRSRGFGIPIPIGTSGVFLGLSYRYTRYWSDETAIVATNGTLNIPQTISEQSYLNERTYDIYRLANHPEQSIVDHPNENELLGGTYPDFDSYSVSAQGVGGSIRPFIFQSNLFSQNVGETYVPMNGPSVDSMKMVSGIQFRFLNDFSNSYRQTNKDVTQHRFPYSAPEYGNDDSNDGYDESKNMLAGSRSVVYFTNAEINGTNPVARAKGFVDVTANQAKGFVRMGNSGSLSNSKGTTQIGGFMITSESGVTYHFALPVYSYNELNKTISDDGTKYTSTDRSEPYAYTWLLTAITGPDYVDRGAVGLDSEDWGYWVAFDYGKWTKDYNWRNPAQGYTADLEQGYKYFSRGTKEVYYLNAIRTRSHVAVFEKEMRKDGKSTSPISMVQDYGSFNESSASSLRLNKIYLINASDYGSISTSAGIVSNARAIDLYNNVVDKTDVDQLGRSQLEGKAIRILDFSYDYSLVKGTPNSFALDNVGAKGGRLTLNRVLTRGKSGARILPPVEFVYGDDPTSASGTLTKTSFTSSNGGFKVGDLLESNNDETYCGVVMSKRTVNGQYVYDLHNNSYALGNVTLRTTKNPSYDKEAYDHWQMFKSDIDKSLIGRNERLARMTTNVSSNSVDVWNLRRINSVLGAAIEVDYESGDYFGIAYQVERTAVVRKIEKIADNKVRMTIDRAVGYDEMMNNIIPMGQFLAREKKEIWKLTQYGVPYIYSRTNSYSVVKESFTNLGVHNIGANSFQIDAQASASMIGNYFQNSSTGNISDINGRTDIIKNLEIGNVKFDVPEEKKGGGIRVKGLRVRNMDGQIDQSLYEYRKLYGSKESSGVVTYEPFGMEVDDAARVDREANSGESARKVYRRELYKDLSEHLVNAREIPAPGVMYEYVSISQKSTTSSGDSHDEGKIINRYRVFDKRMVHKAILQSDLYTGGSTPAKRKNIVYRNYTSNIGDLLFMHVYDNRGKLISKQENRYIYDLMPADRSDISTDYYSAIADFNYQGFTNERYGDGRSFKIGSDTDWQYTFTMSAREHYPSVLLSKEETDYLNRVTNKTENLSFDFYSGALTKSVSNDSYGNRFMTVVFPAYRKYAAMGLRTQNASNKHMLAQEAGSITYKVNSGNQALSVVSATAQTWNNTVPVLNTDDGSVTTQSAIWRKKDSYAWLPTGGTVDGMTAIGDFSELDFINPTTSHANWQKTAGITLYNPYSKALEATDINGQYAATRLGYKHSKVTVTGGPAKYREIAFSGAEDEAISGSNATEVLKGNATVTTAAAHTGHNALQLANGQTGFSYTVPVNSLTAGRTYTASLWVRPTSGTAHNVKLYYKIGTTEKGASVSTSSTKQAGGWTLVTLTLNGSDLTAGSTLEVGCINSHATAVYADDFRFQPLDAATVAYVYDRQSGELTHILDNNNLYTRYEYDGMGSLKAVYTEQLGRTPFKVQEYGMHYRTYVYKSSEASGVFTRNTCGSGYAGHTVTYVVPVGDQTSTISQEDADAKAQAKVQANGQAYANANAGCELVQREAYIASFRSNPCNSTGQTNGTLWFKNGDFAQIGTIPQDYSVVSGITVYAGSIGEETAAPGWYAGLYSEPGDGSMVRVYEVGFNGELTRYILCPAPSTPPVVGGNTITANIYDMNMPEPGMEPDRMLTISSSRTYSVPVTVSGRVAIVDADGQFELVGGTNFSALIPAGSTYTSQQIYFSLEMVGVGNVKVQIKDLTCSPANPDGQTVQLIGNEYIPSQQDSY